jgi:hypothetical protein
VCVLIAQLCGFDTTPIAVSVSLGKMRDRKWRSQTAQNLLWSSTAPISTKGGPIMARSKKILITLLVLAVGAFTAREVYAQIRMQQLMADKLRHAQKLLEGIALAKFDKIEKHADELIRLSKTAEWLAASKSPRYEQYSNEFQAAAEAIVTKAKAKNIDGVTLAYFDLTRSCVRCHQHIREVRDARRHDNSNEVVVAVLGRK